MSDGLQNRVRLFKFKDIFIIYRHDCVDSLGSESPCLFSAIILNS